MPGFVKAMQTEDTLLEVGKWTDGVVNARPGKDIPKTGLIDAVNVNLTEDGRVARRSGSTLAVGVAVKGSSCYADDHGIYFKDGTELKRATENAGLWSVATIDSGLDPELPLYWTSGQGSCWYSNGDQKGRISYGEKADFSLEMPAGQPSLTANSEGGSLPAGRYGVAVSFISNTGEESGTQIRVYVDVPAGKEIRDSFDLNPYNANSGKILVSNIPQPTSYNIAMIRLYLTEANGTVCYKYADIPSGQSMYVLTGGMPKGQVLTNELTDAFPSCKHIAVWRGYMLGADGNTLWHSEPQRFGLCQLQENFIQFTAPITMIAPIDDGFYVVTDRTYFFNGGTPKEWSPREVLPYGNAIPGTYWRHPVKMEVGWFCEKGAIFARVGGQLINETVNKIAPKKYVSGASLFRRENGVEQVVNTFSDGGEGNVMTASDFTDAEIIRAKVS